MTLTLITGASSGIGEAAARLLAAKGHRVILVARNRSRLDEIADEIGTAAIVEACDASDGEAVLEMAERVRRGTGVPDAIINCAGAGAWKWIDETSPAEADAMMRAPYYAAFNVTHAFMRDLLDRNRGVIVHVNSPASIVPWPGATGYVAARWALRGLHEALCEDLWNTGVRSCQAIFGRVSSAYFENNPGALERMPGVARTIRTVSPEECARVIARLVEHPRRQMIYPFRLRLYSWSYTVAPWVVRWLMRRTGARRPAENP